MRKKHLPINTQTGLYNAVRRYASIRPTFQNRKSTDALRTTTSARNHSYSYGVTSVRSISGRKAVCGDTRGTSTGQEAPPT